MLNRNQENMPVTYHFGLKTFFDGYLTTSEFLCDGYVIGSPILFDGHLIKEKL